MQAREVEAELVRCRDRLHKLEASESAFRERIRAVERRLGELGPQVERMARADEIAAAVTERVSENRGILFSRWQKLGAGLVGLVAIADFIRGAVSG